ncbi:unnamed protein product [Phytophthora fragariaefolia]|uniref:Unnamed protein product n=1 Tax=Phytophthora fragariaefolia TaxID=1490495 RepID=A0A9W7CI14_9STRA|nr:unnamed protein product [Phytophthora fragariaefolia]
MVRVPGSSGDSQGFHRESTEEDVKIKTGPANELSTEEGSPPTTWKTPGSSDRQSAGRSSDDENEEGSAMALEEKPRPPPQVPSGTPADRDANRGPPDGDPTVATEGPSSNKTPPASHPASKKKKLKTARRKLKAPGSEAGDHEEPHTMTDDQLESAFHYKSHRRMHEDPVMKIMRPKPIGELQGPVKAPREASDMLDAVKILMRSLHPNWKSSWIVTVCVGHLGSGIGIGELRRAATDDVGTVWRRHAPITEGSARDKRDAKSSASPPSRMQSFFDAAMERFLKEQQASSNMPAAAREPADPKLSGAQDVDMKSVGSAHSHLSEYDPDDLNVDVPARAAVAATDSSGAGTVLATRIRVSAISDLKEFSGKGHDEDRARSWFSKVKSAFMRDQAPDSEKCLVFGDLRGTGTGG